ncbi:hypothetical protein [Jannaschia sp. S6380]|nr:hypothetical protein [Jannaschia sp. S6380]
MSRQSWMDHTIETVRATDIVLPWTRRPTPAPDPRDQPAAARGKG